ncbi:hypothetical protein N0X72_12070 [Streptomyces carpaticus]|uniref:hypothetical protein n=1 Tax=Streptomyces carpaticus TaxID=285558 RepID=UPI00220D9ECF|nr:hypothetical protein N0X72_12070 [Streptomyces carpaticus]
MPDTADSRKRPRTLAEKIQWLRELKTPRGEQPPSYDATARQISQTTGVSISGPYFWELATGRTTNPKLHHLQALARFFTVPIAYLSDVEADFTQLETELELLRALKQRGVRTIKVQGARQEPADLGTVQQLLGRLHQLELSEDDDVREHITSLGAEQRDTVREIVADAAVLRALGDNQLRDLVRAASGLNTARLTTATALAGDPALLDALTDESARGIAARASALTGPSQRAVLALIDHLHQVEQSSSAD